MRGWRDLCRLPTRVCDEAADQISGRNLPVFKTGSVYSVSGVPHETIVFVFPLPPVEP